MTDQTTLSGGATVPGEFSLLSQSELTEFRGRGLYLRHKKTGCEIYHIHRDDRDNLFAFAFKTPPGDNTGVAHILEHTVLCGSRHFPAKDPFLQLLKGSMNTFMNAFTFPDKTVYPASSQVEQDFYNLFRVYGDAVFFPLLRKESFLQEGQRREFTGDGRLRAVGIVYNEMKGNYSSHESIAAEWALRSLFPESPYGFDSGGEPEAILDLSYEEFLAFHRAYYHPSNCKIFLYGDIPTEKHLHFLEENFLSHFDAGPMAPEIFPTRRWKEPRRLEKSYPAGEGESVETGSSVTINWLLPPVEDPERVLAFEVLSEILLSNAGSPLRKALIESELGEDLSAPTGLETEIRELVFSVGLRGTSPEKQGEIEDLVSHTLKALVQEGLDRERVEGALRRVEFRNREVRAGAAFGLRLMRRSLRGWLHGQGPEDTMAFAPFMEKLKKEVAGDPRFFEKLIDRHLLANPHRSVLVVKPDPALGARQEERIRQRLDREEAGLSEPDRRALKEELRAFQLFQDTPDSPEILVGIPSLSLEDIPRELEIIPTEVLSSGKIAGFYAHDLYTNGIVYLDLAFDLGSQNPPDLFLPLFSAALTGIGAGGRSYDQIALEMALRAGGFGTRLEAGQVVGGTEPRQYLFLRLKSLEEGLPQALDLVQDILLHPDLEDERRLRDIFLGFRNSLKGAIIPGGHAFATARAGRGLSAAEAVEEKWKGISQYRFISELDPASAGRILAENFHRIRLSALNSSSLIANVTVPSAFWPRVEESLGNFVAALPEKGRPRKEGNAPLTGEGFPNLEGIAVPSAVGFAATAVPGAFLGEKEHAHEAVLAHLLRTGYLWEKIRMKGGAYGAFCSAQGRNGVVSFASYRDPSILSTLEAFREALEAVARDGIESESAKNAVIGTLAREMKPLSPGGKGIVAFRRILYGLNDELRARHRNFLLETREEDLQAAAERLLRGFHAGYSAILAGRDALDQASASLPGLTENIWELPL